MKTIEQLEVFDNFSDAMKFVKKRHSQIKILTRIRIEPCHRGNTAVTINYIEAD